MDSNFVILGESTKFKIDCGADVTLLTKATYDALPQKPQLNVTTHQLTTAGGEKLQCYGTFKGKTRYKGRHYRDRIYVAECANNLLSRNMCTSMGILTLNIDECNDFTDNDIFGDIETIKGEPVKIELKDDVTPYHINSARRVAIPLMDKVEADIKRMERQSIIAKITEPTDWCSPMAVTLKKNGSVRICVDLRQLNRAVKRERYMLPTIEDVTFKLQGCKVFSTLDATSGYHQLALDENSAKLTTFMTPFGRFMFKRLPFGITSASEIFQRKMNEIIEGIPGVATFQDDIIVAGENVCEHDERLKKVFYAVHEAGLKLNKKKCVFRKEELDYLGHKFGADGMCPSPEKVKAIKEMKEPGNVAELRRFLGMMNYLGSYVPNLSSIVRPLNDLLKKDTTWTWGQPQKQAFNNVKYLLITTPTLSYYDKNKPVTVAADSSSFGLGAFIYQTSDSQIHPIAYASRTLTASEQRYAQIEKECLAATWACEKFHRYLYGLDSFRLITDHKPLVPIINSDDLNKVPLRCQRLLIRMMQYNPRAEYMPGKKLVVPDTLSRQPIENAVLPNKNTESENEEVQIKLQEEITRVSWPI